MAKKIIAAMIMLCLCLCAVCPVFAADTKIETETPEWVALDLSLNGGAVKINGTEYKSSCVVMIPYSASVTIEFFPGEGKKIKNVTLNGEDITEQIENERYEIPSLLRDAALAVDQSAIPGTSDNSNINLWLLLIIVSLLGIITAKTKRKKHE